MKKKKFIVGNLQENCYVYVNEKVNEAIIVDPGAEAQRIMEYIEENEVKIIAIFLTHYHFDHIGATDELKKKYNVPVFAHEEEAKVMHDIVRNLSSKFDFKKITADVDRYIKDGETVKVGKDTKIKAIEVPGHTEHSLCYYIEEDKVVFTGDTLFKGTTGRRDLYDGSYNDLSINIKEKLYVLPDETIVYPGHGKVTTIGEEKETNNLGL